MRVARSEGARRSHEFEIVVALRSQNLVTIDQVTRSALVGTETATGKRTTKKTLIRRYSLIVLPVLAHGHVLRYDYFPHTTGLLRSLVCSLRVARSESARHSHEFEHCCCRSFPRTLAAIDKVTRRSLQDAALQEPLRDRLAVPWCPRCERPGNEPRSRRMQSVKMH